MPCRIPSDTNEITALLTFKLCKIDSTDEIPLFKIDSKTSVKVLPTIPKEM